MSNTKYPGSDYQELFNHLHDEHDLILLESQMQDIIHIVNKMPVPDRESELIEMLEEMVHRFDYSASECFNNDSDELDLLLKAQELIQSVKQSKI